MTRLNENSAQYCAFKDGIFGSNPFAFERVYSSAGEHGVILFMAVLAINQIARLRA
jgi:hypothetical protein